VAASAQVKAARQTGGLSIRKTSWPIADDEEILRQSALCRWLNLRAHSLALATLHRIFRFTTFLMPWSDRTVLNRMVNAGGLDHAGAVGPMNGYSVDAVLSYPRAACRSISRIYDVILTLAMKGKTKERWQEVCEQAAIEKDPEKLLKLVAEINRLLHEKLGRLEDKAPRNPNP
jgi:hypothetical protein